MILLVDVRVMSGLNRDYRIQIFLYNWEKIPIFMLIERASMSELITDFSVIK